MELLVIYLAMKWLHTIMKGCGRLKPIIIHVGPDSQILGFFLGPLLVRTPLRETNWRLALICSLCLAFHLHSGGCWPQRNLLTWSPGVCRWKSSGYAFSSGAMFWIGWIVGPLLRPLMGYRFSVNASPGLHLMQGEFSKVLTLDRFSSFENLLRVIS